ncbi:MAG: FAD-dependent oxidoreductase [Planctomycetota bacterium]
MTTSAFRALSHEVDFCVVGGGMAGVTAALAAARHGAQVALMQDRPVLGGNSSSECRVHIQGADRHNSLPNLRETGILEELRMENLYRNPQRSYSIWDTVLYEKLHFHPNVTLLLNCSCNHTTMDGGRIVSVSGWQTTTQTVHTVRAKLFADCSGDGVLAPLTGAECRMGREARAEFGESIAPEVADDRTMGMSCLFQARKHDSPQPFIPPDWAEVFESCDELPGGERRHRWFEMGYWWVELGGEDHSIHDTERLRDELLAIAYGVWDHVKNHCPQHREAAANWALDWLQFLPAKRESRRFVGDHILTQNDIEAEGRFDDLVAYGGWTMDDHHPAGFRAVELGEPPTIFHPAPSPYGIPYRSLYSKNVANLMFAGRNASCTHAAMSSTRVMGTCSSMGQAVGTAAAMAAARGIDPRGLLDHVDELQQALIDDDCYLPWVAQDLPGLTRQATLKASVGDPEPVRDGVNRPVGEHLHAWPCRVGDSIAYTFDRPRDVAEVVLILDTGLDQMVMMSHHQADDQLTAPPDVMPRAFRVEGRVDGNWQPLITQQNNHQRHVRYPVGTGLTGVRFTLDETWGADESRVYGVLVR